jgi:alpha-soluble NSF attachment protein
MGVAGGISDRDTQERSAVSLMVMADKKLRSSSFWFFGSSETKYEEAAELYTRAANTFKLLKNWKDAANGFNKAAECHLSLQSKYEAATDYVNAANCLKKSDAKEAIHYYKMAIGFYTDMGRFTMAAKYQREVAELYEYDLADLEGAIHAYQTAADWYGAEDAPRYILYREID